MKTKILMLLTVVLLAGCASTRTATPTLPVQADVNALKSDYRKTVEVILVSCFERNTDEYLYAGDYRKAYNVRNRQLKTETISVVETTKTGERFEMSGCFGKVGDRFKMSY